MERTEVRPRPRISVLTVTNRPGGIDVTWNSLKKQSFQDFEWILADELYESRKNEVAAYVNDERLKHIPTPRVPEDLWNLNKSYNAALRVARGDLVVSLQDYIWIRGDGLAKFWDLHTALGPRVFLTGAGHKGRGPRPVDLQGKVTIYEEPYAEKPTEITERDSRLEGEIKLEESNPSWWETNWAAAPLLAFYELGGYPEQHDGEFYGCDNLSIAYPAHLNGYRFFLDKTNQCVGIDHGELWPRPEDWEERHGRHGGWGAWYNQWIDAGRPSQPYLDRQQDSPAQES